jgi:hypothetical protein
LVVVGDFDHFRLAGGDKWRIVTSVFEARGARVNASRLMKP